MARVISRRRQRERRIRFRVAASLMDLLGVAACAIVIVLCVALFRSLGAWATSNYQETFSLLEETVRKSVLVTGR